MNRLHRCPKASGKAQQLAAEEEVVVGDLADCLYSVSD
jgi:hypothetical protein